MISKAWVFVDGLDAQPVVCGVIKVAEDGSEGRFRYGKSFLARPDAFSLDPINLPLTDAEFITRNNHGLFGVLRDAGADAWGRKVILSLHNTKPQNQLEFLLAGSGMGVGALVFSLSSSKSKPKFGRNSLGDVDMLLKAKDAILDDEAIPQEAKVAFEYGSSMGGARPKTTIHEEDTAWLAKFNRSDDLVNMVKTEHACMTMLGELPCRVAHTRVLSSPAGEVLLVKRFELAGNKPTHHYLSANSLFNMDKVSEADLRQQYSYGAIAEFILKHGAQPTDAHDLYYRMVFNVLMGNTDDHARNHALLYSFSNKQWRLSPAYDVLPINSSRQHGIGIGVRGREGSLENLLSQSLRFGLKAFKAKKIISEIQELCSEWPGYFSKLNVGDGDIERLKGIIPGQ